MTNANSNNQILTDAASSNQTGSEVYAEQQSQAYDARTVEAQAAQTYDAQTAGFSTDTNQAADFSGGMSAEAYAEEMQSGKSKGVNLSRVAVIVASVAVVVVIAGAGIGGYFAGQSNGAANAMPAFAEGQFGEMPEGGGDFSGERPEGMGNFAGGPGLDYSMFVEEGIIDQNTADEMEAYMQEYMQDMQGQLQGQSQSQS